ncbi:MAG: hypothetical protein U9N57_06380 [Pseudomonadota bacterium]|nr:hypothetical protein [Pseudomonadota bacterium]
MATINPNLASATLTLQNQQSNSTLKVDSKADERPQELSRSTVSGNSSVSLSESSQELSTDYLQLNRQQSVQSSDSVENKTTDASETNIGLTYASNLQTQRNYLSNVPTLDK